MSLAGDRYDIRRDAPWWTPSGLVSGEAEAAMWTDENDPAPKTGEWQDLGFTTDQAFFVAPLRTS